jgi:hypothetical protein
MNIEDLVISLLLSRIPLNQWDQNLIASFYDQVSRGSGFTEKQSALAVKTVKRHSAALSTFLQKDILLYLENPSYRLPIRKISNAKRLTVIDHPVHKKAVTAVFPYNEAYITQIRKNKNELGTAVWDKDEKYWIFSLSENAIQFLMDFAEQENFEVDEEFQNYVQQSREVIANMENFIPMLTIAKKTPKLVNCSKFVPPLESTEILESVFEARQKGIFTWDDTISNFLESDEVNPVTRNFLKSDPGEKLLVDNEIHGISDLTDIIKNMSPCLFVIPGGSEHENLMMSYEFLKSIGITNHEMSVMFRLPSDTHELFNNFVKNMELNSPISEQTKIVFVSSKLPKPVLKSKIKFHSVINLGYSNVHYTMKDFVGNHENLVFYSKKKELRDSIVAFM